MKEIFRKRFLMFAIILNLILYFPSFFVFFTHDDFFHLFISDANNLGDFFDFLNIFEKPWGYGFYRPVTTQFFYFLGRHFFNLNQVLMHTFAYSFFLSLIYLVYKFTYLITRSEDISRITVILYATSSIHFMSLYFLGAFQEVGMAFFVLTSIIFYLSSKPIKSYGYLLSLLLFIFALASKETAIVTPFLMTIAGIYIGLKNIKRIKNHQIYGVFVFQLKKAIPFFAVLFLYLYLRVSFYGFVRGDSYVWDFSPRVINTLFWYGLWSFNMPEMLVDFIGPGLKINPNLFKYWSGSIIPIFAISGFLMAITAVMFLKKISKSYSLLNSSAKSTDFSPRMKQESMLVDKILWALSRGRLLIFLAIWFLISISPVIFLPYHKFSYYLTLPIIAFGIYLAYLIKDLRKIYLYVFIFLWVLGSFLTLELGRKTHWVPRGAKTAERVDAYFRKNISEFNKYSTIVFIDTENDNKLPWRPSEIVKISLSDQNYFNVFYPGQFNVYYGSDNLPEGVFKIEARQFIGY